MLTPNCSNTGYDDTNGNLDVEEEHDEEQPGDHGEHGWEEEHQSQTQVGTIKWKIIWDVLFE